MVKVKFKGIVKGQPTTVTLKSEDPLTALVRFCTNYGADIDTFKRIRV